MVERSEGEHPAAWPGQTTVSHEDPGGETACRVGVPGAIQTGVRKAD